MSDPIFKIPELNYTQIPNALFDEWIPKLREGELRVLLVIMRQTFGWQNKVWDHISMSQLMKKTGMGRKACTCAAKLLSEKGLITRELRGSRGRQEAWYTLQVENAEQTQKTIEDSNNYYPDPKAPPHPDPKDPHKRKPITKEKKETFLVSPEVETLKNYFLEAIKKAKPDYSKKPTKNWDEKLAALLKIRTADKILKALDWALHDSFWKANVLSPNGLYNNLDMIETKMAGNPTKEDRRALIKKHWKEARNHDNCGQISVGLHIIALGEKVEFVNGPKTWVVPYDLPDDEWKEQTGWTE